MSRARPFVSVIYAEVTAPVVEAQTLPMLAALQSAGRPTDAVVFASPRRLFVPGDWAAHRRALGLFEQTLGRAPAVLTHPPRAQSFAGLGKRLAKTLEERGLGDAVLVCRQPRATLVACSARDALRRGDDAPLVVHDMRGIRPEEYLMTLGRGERELSADEGRMLATYREQEAQACSTADAVLCVSQAMKRHVNDLHADAAEHVVHVANLARTVADAERLRATARKKLRVPDDAILLAYAGTMASWQLPEATALFAAAVANQAPEARMLWVTPDAAAARAASRAAGVTKPIIKSATPDQTHEWIAAADYGLLLRDDSQVNRVACPVKFGEYLACGVRPVLTPTVGDQSQLCMDTGLGVVVPLTDAGSAAKRLLLDARSPFGLGAGPREKRRAWVADNISPERTAQKLLEQLAPILS